MVLKATIQKESHQSHPNATSETAVWRCSSKQVILEISQYLQENICVGAFFFKVSGLTKCNFIQKRLQHRCFLVNIAKFLRIAFLCNASGGCFCQFDKVIVLTCSDLLFLIKNIMWDGFYYKGSTVDLVRERYLHNISRNRALLLINLQKTKNCPK